jgi:hypothetical protein
VSTPAAARNGSPAAAAALLGAHVRVPDHVVHRAFVRETVILNLTTGRYHGISPMGGQLLDLLVGGATVKVAAAILAEEYQRPIADVEGDVCALCEELREQGLIEVSLNGSC